MDSSRYVNNFVLELFLRTINIKMKASVSKMYGTPDVFKIEEVTKPIPKHNEVLVRVYAATVTGSDIMMRIGKPYVGRLYLGLSKPKTTILGFDFAGQIVETGKNVTSFNVGDKVFGGTTALGCYAEYTCVNVDDVIATIPENINYQSAAPVSGSAITVMNFLKGLAKIKAGDTLLINGASGSLGTYSVQIAKHFGAVVTGVCSSKNMKMVKDLGADFVIDYTNQDFTKNGKQYDIVFDTTGKITFSSCKNSLTQKGIFLSSVVSFPLLLQMMITSLFGKKKVKSSSTGMLSTKVRLNYFMQLKELLEAEKIKTVIDTSYPLSQMCEAHKYVEKGHKKGNVVIETNTNYQLS
jgi:NADPH:quinone reductase-like Zn-dependent oxidoreductase